MKHHHDALWKEETHYTWISYILAGGLIYVLIGSQASNVLKSAIAIALSVIGILLCVIAFRVVRLEGQYFHRALQIRNRLNRALQLHNYRLKNDKHGYLIYPDDETKFDDFEFKEWHKVDDDANMPVKRFLRTSPKFCGFGIRHLFQLTLLLPMTVFLVGIVVSILLLTTDCFA